MVEFANGELKPRYRELPLLNGLWMGGVLSGASFRLLLEGVSSV